MQRIASLLPAFLLAFSRFPGALSQTLLTEDAEQGLAYIVDGTSGGYALIQTDVVAQGEAAFHLANPNLQDNWFSIDRELPIGNQTQLFFLSRLGWADAEGQTARVQVSTDGGLSWPHEIYAQKGTGSAGEGGFSLRQIDLSPFANQNVRLQFYYDYTPGYTGFPQVHPGVGWYVDDIQVADQLDKLQYSIGNPTTHEQLHLEYINRARADALVEADRLAAETDPDIVNSYAYFGIRQEDIIEQFQWYASSGAIDRHAQPLSFNAELLTAAQLHTQDMFDNRFQGHVSSAAPPAPFSAGDSLGGRLVAVGYNFQSAGENVFSYADSVAHAHAGFNVDWGDAARHADPYYNPSFAGQGMQNPAGHRLNIHNGDYNEIGVGVINGSNGAVGPQLVTQDFGDAGDVTFVTGVVYEDLNANRFYDLGEGRSGVRIDVEGSAYFAVSSESGGYSVPISGDGAHEVLFSGGGFADWAATAVVADSQNVKVDYLVSSISLAAD
ncbi:MAG: CAP domain-containing protein, partial [Planctomycetota bacterium]